MRKVVWAYAQPMPTFDDVMDWLTEREGQEVYVEVGVEDPTLDNNDYFPVAMHVTLGKVGLGEDAGHQRGLAWLPFSGGDRNRIYFDPARVTDITINHAGLKLTFHDSIYVAMSGG